MIDKTEIKQQLLFFKNEMLSDLRKFEVKFNSNLREQNMICTERYEFFEQKISELTERMAKIQSLNLDNTEFTEKIKTFLKFTNKAEENFIRIDSKILSIQKENIYFFNNIERIIKENLKYPGIIGRDSKFLNFRDFIDYTIKNLKDLIDYKDEIRNFNLNEFRRKIKKDIFDFRLSITNDYRHAINLVDNNIKDLDIKIEDLIKRNNKTILENDSQFKELKKNINKSFSEYQTKFESLEGNYKEKYIKQLNENNTLQNMKNEKLTEINDIKPYFEKIKLPNDNNNIKENNNIRNNTKNENINNIQSFVSDNNILFNKNESPQIYRNSVIFSNQNISKNKEKYIMLMNELKNNSYFNNINKSDNDRNKEGEDNIDLSLNKNFHQVYYDKSKSFEKYPDKHKFKIRNKRKNLSSFQNEVIKKEEKKNFNSYFNYIDKEIRKKNYSITNIPNIKLKKVIIPEYVSRGKLNQTSNSISSDNKGSFLISNDLSFIIPQKNINYKYNGNKKWKSAFNISKTNRQKEIKNSDTHNSNSIKRKIKVKNSEKYNSSITIKQKTKYNIFKNYLFKKMKNYNLSFEKEKNSKDEQIQTGFRKTFNLNNKAKDIIKINSKNSKKNRKIQL